jgi:RimJ/RimL family protein N-acetyltransferase
MVGGSSDICSDRSRLPVRSPENGTTVLGVPGRISGVNTTPEPVNHPEPVEIVAGRIQLRPFLASDADAVYAACQDLAIQRWTRVPVPFERHHAEKYVGDNSADGWAAGRGRSYAVTDATTGELLAAVGLVAYDPDEKTAEVGYWVAPTARGQGVAAQATRAVAGWCFGALGIARLEWLAEVGNGASHRVAEKAGFTLEGILRDRLRARDGSRADAWVGSLLPRDL